LALTLRGLRSNAHDAASRVQRRVVVDSSIERYGMDSQGIDENSS